MKVEQSAYVAGWKHVDPTKFCEATNAQLVLCFGDRTMIAKQSLYDELRAIYGLADIVMVSTAGEISENMVWDETVVANAITFEKTICQCISSNINLHESSFEAGKLLMAKLPTEKLTAVLVFCDGNHINGSELVEGINRSNDNRVPVTGGLAGDAGRFEQTLVGLNDYPQEGMIVLIGLYGEAIQIGHGSVGGWDQFGPERVITKATKNVLFEIDGENALDLYKTYLGKYADELPGSALLFPLSINMPDSTDVLVRTVLTVDEETKSMTFAGNIPEGSKVRLMIANFDKVVNGADISAKNALETLGDDQPELAILISCVGRKMVLKHRADDEIEAARNILGNTTAITGFYSYGEISPFSKNCKCELHNQTMTITTLKEKV
jgi:hypothetical protein